MTVIYNMSIDRADKPWIGDRRFTEVWLSAADSAIFWKQRAACEHCLLAVAHLLLLLLGGGGCWAESSQPVD